MAGTGVRKQESQDLRQLKKKASEHFMSKIQKAFDNSVADQPMEHILTLKQTIRDFLEQNVDIHVEHISKDDNQKVSYTATMNRKAVFQLLLLLSLLQLQVV